MFEGQAKGSKLANALEIYIINSHFNKSIQTPQRREIEDILSKAYAAQIRNFALRRKGVDKISFYTVGGNTLIPVSFILREIQKQEEDTSVEISTSGPDGNNYLFNRTDEDGKAWALYWDYNSKTRKWRTTGDNKTAYNTIAKSISIHSSFNIYDIMTKSTNLLSFI